MLYLFVVPDRYVRGNDHEEVSLKDTIFGAYPSGGITEFEQRVGPILARRYYFGLGSNPAMMVAGIRNSVGLASRDFQANVTYPYADVIAGRADAKIDAFAAKVKTWQAAHPGSPRVEFNWSAEPDNSSKLSLGTPDEHRRAFLHVKQRFMNKGVNVRWGLNVTGVVGRDFSHYWDPSYEFYAIDPYNYADPGAAVWDNLESKVAGAVAFAAAHSVPWQVCEMGCPESPTDPKRRARWLLDMASLMRRNNCEQALYFDSNKQDETRPRDWRVFGVGAQVLAAILKSSPA